MNKYLTLTTALAALALAAPAIATPQSPPSWYQFFTGIQMCGPAPLRTPTEARNWVRRTQHMEPDVEIIKDENDNAAVVILKYPDRLNSSLHWTLEMFRNLADCRNYADEMKVQHELPN